jgi:hypothetical protein
MSSRTRPRTPWYAAATRRLTLVRVGLPTLAACMLAIGPGMAASAPRRAAQGIAALVARTGASPADHRGGREDDGGDDAR